MLQFPLLPARQLFSSELEKIQILFQVIEHLPLEYQLQQAVFHRQLLKSSLFSARIEGNQLSLAAASQLPVSPKEKNQLEVANVITALQQIPGMPTKLTQADIRQLHLMVMAGLDVDAGKFRSESSAIYDQFGNIVYLTPNPAEMKKMLDELLLHVAHDSQVSWQQQLIVAAACHYYFEKIHPFVDGNGRTGRVLLQYQLSRAGIFNRLILPLDQFFDQKRSEYYFFLEKNTRQIEGFVRFFLEGIIWALEATLDDIKHLPAGLQQASPSLGLLPRRQEILAVITDHPMISLDAIARRFMTVSRRTIANDLRHLLDKGLLERHGTTRGAVYSAAGYSSVLSNPVQKTRG